MLHVVASHSFLFEISSRYYLFQRFGGKMAKSIVFIGKIVMIGAGICGRGFVRAFKQEIELSKEAARRSRITNESRKLAENSASLSLEEAMQILNIKRLDPEKVQKNYEFLFAANEKAKGGSFYLQSKVFRAKERIDAELKSKRRI